MGFNVDASRIALPRGRVFFARKSSAGVLGPLLHLGNCSKLEFGTMGDDITEITDFSQNSGTPLTRISRTRKPEFPLSLYEVLPDNLALLFMGDKPSELTQLATAVTGEVLQGGAKVGAIYQFAKYGPYTGITITVGATAAVLNTDYVVRDATLGIIELIALPGSEVEGAAVTADYTPTAYSAGSGFQQVKGGTLQRIEGRLKYLGNSNTGPRHQLDIWNLSIEADGAFPFIAQDPIEYGLKCTVLSDPAHADLWTVTELSDGSGSPLP